jgi:hypothetical protein
MITGNHQEPHAPLDEKALERMARASLDESVAHLDATTLSRLNRARRQAMAESEKSFFQRHWLPMSAVACALFAVAIALPLIQQPADQVAQPGVEDAYYGAAEDAALVEDLDLVLWLMENEDHAS